MIAARMGPAQNIDENGIDPHLGHMQRVERHVRGGIAQIAAPLVAVQDRAFDPVPMAKHVGRVARAAIAERLANGGGADRAEIALKQGRDAHLKAQICARGFQRLRRAAATFAIAKILAHHDMGQAEPGCQDITREVLGRELIKARHERQFKQNVDAEFLQAIGAGGCGSNVTIPSGISGRRAMSMTWAWPRWTPSKFPIAAEAPRRAVS